MLFNVLWLINISHKIFENKLLQKTIWKNKKDNRTKNYYIIGYFKLN